MPRSTCHIRGCSRATHKGLLCRAHYALVPRELGGTAAMIEGMTAQLRAVARVPRRQLAAVRELLAAGAAGG